jgi:tRNA threonylcarbamoyladenosine biosynthesis protein TsaB
LNKLIYILNIETSTTNCSVSLSENGRLIGLKEDNSLQYSHAERLHVYIDELLQTAKVSKTQIAAVGISKGPGSYTGLRIGVSAAKGLCYALKIPLISILTLEALAHQVVNPQGTIVAMLDARRLEVYSAIYDASYNETRQTEAEVITLDSYKELLDLSPVYFIGNGVAKTQQLVSHPNAIFIENKLPSASQMCTLTHAKFNDNDFEDVAYFEPYYLKDFIAIPSKKQF